MSRVSYLEQPDKLTVVIEISPPLFSVFFLLFWLFAWFIGGLIALAKEIPSIEGFIGWFLFGLPAMIVLIWHLKRKQIVSVTKDFLALKSDLLGFGPTSKYPLSEISQLISIASFGTFSSVRLVYYPKRHHASEDIVFTYRGAVMRIGPGLSVELANEIVDKINARIEQYTPKS